jgi:hypothetical protein
LNRHASKYARDYGQALDEHFVDLTRLRSKALGIQRKLGGKKPVPPDLWLIVNGMHVFIEVKLPGDRIRDAQIAGSALMARYLRTKKNKKKVSFWLVNLHRRGAEPSPMPLDFASLCEKFDLRWRAAHKLPQAEA